MRYVEQNKQQHQQKSTKSVRVRIYVVKPQYPLVAMSDKIVAKRRDETSTCAFGYWLWLPLLGQRRHWPVVNCPPAWQHIPFHKIEREKEHIEYFFQLMNIVGHWVNAAAAATAGNDDRQTTETV